MKILALVLVLHLSVTQSAEVKCNSYPCLIFEDNFDKLDLDKWRHEITAGGGGNNEFQYYHNSRINSYTKDGKLYIKPTLTSDDKGEEFVRSGTLDLWGAEPANVCTGNNYNGCYRKAENGILINPFQSARLRSVHSFSYKYGKLEVEAKMPTGDWIWPAIWMLPKNNVYGNWPASGEIDIVEVRGNRNLFDPKGTPVGIAQAGMTLHWGPKFPYNGYPKTHALKTLSGGKTFGTDFHKYQVEWGADIGIKFAIDDELLMTINPPNGFWEYGKSLWNLTDDSLNPWKPETGATRMAPFDQPFYILMNVAVGGTNYFGDEQVNQPYPKPWKNNESQNSAMAKFYNAKNLWYPTWIDTNDETAMQVNYIRVWKTKPDA